MYQNQIISFFMNIFLSQIFLSFCFAEDNVIVRENSKLGSSDWQLTRV